MYVGLYEGKMSIQRCKLDAKYPKINTHINQIGSYLAMHFSRGTKYQTSGKRIINILKSYILSSPGTDFTNVELFKEYLEKICVGNVKAFNIYAKCDLNDFAATKYLEKFCGISIDEIINVWNTYFNMKRAIYGFVMAQQYAPIREFVTKLLTTHMVIHLAKHLYIIEIAMDTKSLYHMDQAILCGPRANTFKNYLKNCIQNQDSIEEILSDNDNDLTQFISENAIISDKKFTKLKNFIGKLYKEYRMQYDFLTRMNYQELITTFDKYNDACALYASVYLSRYSSSQTFRSNLIKNIMDSDNLVLNLVFKKDISNFESNQMHNLIIPKIVPMEKIYMIEV